MAFHPQDSLRALLYIFYIKSTNSLLEKNNHRVSNVQANVASIVMRNRVTSFLNDKAVPVTLVASIELFFNLSSDVWKVARVVILEGL